jgi:hypothetical protein
MTKQVDLIDRLRDLGYELIDIQDKEHGLFTIAYRESDGHAMRVTYRSDDDYIAWTIKEMKEFLERREKEKVKA